MTVPSMPHGKWYAPVSDQLVGAAGSGTVLAILVCSVAGNLGVFELNDSADGSGSDFFACNMLAATTQLFDFSPFGGLPFGAGCWIDWTSGVVFICLDK